jgi:3'-phosphoadenosine 5'-phosphosulfate sulfotransferase (PAPS reductase)/FAD synthetase
MEYFFCDTGAELPETYEYLNRLEVVLGKAITRLNSARGFDHWFEVYRGTLPSPQVRWCTRMMKIKPLEEWLGDDPTISYVAIRADERNRKGYVSTKATITPAFPFVEDDIDHEGVLRILHDAGVGLPDYYEWRTRSGCYFCFFQRKAEWIGLADRHPELFARAVAIEKKVLTDAGVDGDASYEELGMRGRGYTWSQGETLNELLERRDEVLAKHKAALQNAKQNRRAIPLVEVLAEALDDDDDSAPCTMCAL